MAPKTDAKQGLGVSALKPLMRCPQSVPPRLAGFGLRILLFAVLLCVPLLATEGRAASVISLKSCSGVPGSFHKRGIRSLVDPTARRIYVYDRTVTGSTGWGALGRLFGITSNRCSLFCAVGHANLRKSRLGPRGFRNTLSTTGRSRTRNFPIANPTTSFRRLLGRGYRAWFVSCQQNAGGGSAPSAPDPAPAAPDPAPAAPDPAPAPAAPAPAPTAPDPSPMGPGDPDSPGDPDNGETEPQ